MRISCSVEGLESAWVDVTEVGWTTRQLDELRGANLSGADLYGANLYGADLSGADLYGVNLYGANLREVNLFGVDLYGAKNGDLVKAQTVIVPEGDIIGWKKCLDNAIS